MFKLNRKKVEKLSYVKTTNKLMRDGGLLLVTDGKGDKPNAMTIGWGLIGTMWRQPFFCVAVRFSRYTFELIEKSEEFTVCLPAKDMENVLEICGTKSGRDIDKFKELKLTAKKGISIEAPYIEECPVHYECKVAFKVEVKPGKLERELEKDVYPKGDYHVLYFGQILGVYTIESADDKLP